jgi:DNA-binding MarR family transcriptional regulator
MNELADTVRANQRATDVVDDLVGQLLGVNRTDTRILDILDQHGRLSAGQLAEASSLTTGAITAVIDRLERAGYAQRVPDPDDRRRVLVEATPRTRELSWELYGPLAEMWRPFGERYSDAELQLLIDFHRMGVEIQQRHAQMLRERLREQPTPASVRQRRTARTEPEQPSPTPGPPD